jgi:dTDP-4-dehydrorhamnose reductase
MRLLGDEALPVTRADLDLTKIEAIPGFLDDLAPQAVINCAAYTKVDLAEREEELATRINSDAVGVMAEWSALRNRPLLTFSTDYVFNGESSTPYVESSPTDPVNAYGRSKLRGEELAIEADALLVRTSWVISGSHPNFVATMLRLAEERALQVVDDQHGCPTICADLAPVTAEALRSGVTGLLHVTNQGPTTWFELARATIAEAGLNPELVSACTTADFPTEAPRPAYSVLDSERILRLGLDRLPPWRESLPAVVAEIRTWL